jgi:hypothetical protein
MSRGRERLDSNKMTFKEIMADSVGNVVYERAFDRKKTTYLLRVRAKINSHFWRSDLS